MIYGGEPLHGNNPSDWETVSILRSDRLGLYGDGLEAVYDKNLKACEYAEKRQASCTMLFTRLLMLPTPHKDAWLVKMPTER